MKHIDNTQIRRSVLTAIGSGAMLAGGAFAGPVAPEPAAPPVAEVEAGSIYDKIWSYATWYDNKENSFLQKFAFTGRLQADAAFFDADQGDFERLQWRRARAGFKATVFQNMTLHAEANLDFNDIDLGDLDDVYTGLTDAYVSWKFSDEAVVKLGKQSAGFTAEGATSSKRLRTLERGPVAENIWFPAEYFTGASIGGDSGNWSYQLGGFSAAVAEEFGEFDSGYFGLASIGYDFADSFGIESSKVRFDYVYNDPDRNGSFATRSLGHVLSLNGDFAHRDFGLVTDLAWGEGFGPQPNVFGLMLMPYYNISDRWQAVFQYSFVDSDGDNGVRMDRYENRISRARGDSLNQFFLGLNCYLYGHKLKWQNGVEYTTMSDSSNSGAAYDGWGFTSGLRLYW